MSKRVLSVAVLVVALVAVGVAEAGIDLSTIEYKGAIDISPLLALQGTDFRDIVYSEGGGGELFVNVVGGTITAPPIYCIGMPNAPTDSTCTRD